jgi:ABC-type lipoprotein release transport system permease subunit
MPPPSVSYLSLQAPLTGVTEPLLAWRADSLTADLIVSSAITSVIMAAVGVLACAAPARRALRIQPTEALRQS